MRFKSSDGRDDIGDVPLGHNGAAKTAELNWDIRGAIKADLFVTVQAGGGIYVDCPAGNPSTISGDISGAVGKNMPITLPAGKLNFSINGKGYYFFSINYTMLDGTRKEIPRAVIVDCYKK